MTDPAIRVFYSYSRQDREMRDRLDDHLSHLRRSGKIVTWCDLQLEPGSEWEKTLLEKLETSDIILLLVSARFLASDYCSETELKRAIDRHNVGKAHVIPVILKSCLWNVSDLPFSKLQVLPTGAKPISSYRDEDEAYADVLGSRRKIAR
ncbi:MAG: toll/interleukin-1 receptor domain-containing protein [Oculatellaceae cyanobacterium bins.114]|nr:toll/interleukin-1 receptor domain-containing protein [Oculatellaceae cyanobacterium bins.114]